jgi:hypothetical protein
MKNSDLDRILSKKHHGIKEERGIENIIGGNMRTPNWMVVRLGIKSVIQKGGLDLVLDYYTKLADKYSVKEGRKYASAKEEVDDIVKNVPELAPIQDKLLVLCESNRKRVGLPV